MGLFSRKKSGQKTSSGSRTATSSEAQAAELRARARRRLIGALVLVLAAVIVVPMMFDEDIESQQFDTPLVLPAVVPPVSAPDRAVQSQRDYADDQSTLSEELVISSDPHATDLPDDEGTTAVAAATQPTTPVNPPAQITAPEANTSSETSPPSDSVRSEPPKPRPEPPVRDKTRTDDGSRALALLEGRIPPEDTSRPAPVAQAQGAFILQIAAYSTDADAQARRTRLVEAGVTNAYVEKGMSNNKTTYRLRVGSFPTRDAAAAAQARLRALGYDNSLLLTR